MPVSRCLFVLFGVLFFSLHPETSLFGMMVYQNIWVKVVHQGHGLLVKGEEQKIENVSHLDIDF